MPINNTKAAVCVFWFRRDLRLNDNRGLFEALTSDVPVLPLFIFDEDIVSSLPSSDHRISYIYDALSALQHTLRSAGTSLLVFRGRPLEIFQKLVQSYQIQAVFCNKDHEPYGIQRDQQIKAFLQSRSIPIHAFLDHLIFDKNDILKANGSPYLVFTPYSRRWKSLLNARALAVFDSMHVLSGFREHEPVFPSLQALGFKPSCLKAPKIQFSREHIESYHLTRDVPILDGSSHIGPALRFGLLSIREVVNKALSWNETFLNELIWRSFYAMILWHFPEVVHSSFRKEYDRIEWINDESSFEAWKSGRTGYPLVDAGMRQLNATGFMHNRLRMITASFLTKHLLTDWRLGEAYFAEKLFDYELSSNNGGWQWVAGSGTDAAPYFRIFNPLTQQKKYDPEGLFVSDWVPENGTSEYVSAVIDHSFGRERCLRAYGRSRV